MACLPFADQIWQIYVLIFILSACSAASTPIFQATIPDLLTDEADYTDALSLSRLAYELENLLSPALAAALLTITGFHWLFAGTAAGFFASALIVGTLTLPSPKPPERSGGFRARLTAGLRIYLATPRLRGLLALNLAVAAAGAMIIVDTVVYVRTVLHGTGREVAFAFMAAGVGSAAAAILLPQLFKRWSDRPVMLAGTLFMSTGLLLGLTRPGLLGLLPIWALLGIGSALVQTPTGRLLRRSAGEVDRPALFTAQFALSHACWLVTYPLAGWLGVALGMTPTFAILAAVVALSGLAARRLWPIEDALILEHVDDPLRHEYLHVHGEHHRHVHEGWEGPEPHSHLHAHGAAAPHLLAGARELSPPHP